jgi:hypothetical protein
LASNIVSSTTYNTSAIFTNLFADTIYYGRVLAINHSGISTTYAALGSTRTYIPNAPTNLHTTTATTTSLTSAWDPPAPVGNTYTLQVSTNNNFIPVAQSSNTALSTATVGGLQVNTTYFAQVNAIIDGSSSVWTSYITTATLAQTPTTLVSTWTAVGISSLTVAWSGASNPANVTLFRVEISSVTVCPSLSR